MNGYDPDPVYWKHPPPQVSLAPLQPPLFLGIPASTSTSLKKKSTKRSSTSSSLPRIKRVNEPEVQEFKKPKNYPRFDLYIQFQSQPQLHLAGVDASYSVAMIKDLIFQARKVKQSEQELVYMKDVLAENNFLGDYGIYSDSTVFLNVSMFPVPIFIKSLAGKTLDFQVLLTDTVLALKEKIFQVEKIPVLQQRLFYGNTCLEQDSHSLVSFRVEPKSTLLLFLHDRDGPLDEILKFAEDSGISRQKILPKINYPRKRNVVACIDCNRRRKKCLINEEKIACQNCFQRKIRCVFPKNFTQTVIIDSDPDAPLVDEKEEGPVDLTERDPFSFLFAAASESLSTEPLVSVPLAEKSAEVEALDFDKGELYLETSAQELQQNSPFKARSVNSSPDLSMDIDTEKTLKPCSEDFLTK